MITIFSLKSFFTIFFIIKCKQWNAHGVQTMCRYFILTILPIVSIGTVINSNLWDKALVINQGWSLHVAKNVNYSYMCPYQLYVQVSIVHIKQFGLHIVAHYQWWSIFFLFLCFHIISNNLSLFMSMSNLILINIISWIWKNTC